MSEAEEKTGEEGLSGQGNGRTVRMGYASVPKLLIEFAIPSIVGMLVSGLYSLISSMFLGQAMGATGLAVTTAAFPVQMVFMALAMLVGNGGNALAALRLGQGRRDEAEVALSNAVTLGIITAIIVAIIVNISPCMEALLSISGTTTAIHDYTKLYIWIISMGLIVQILGFGVNNFIRTAGAPTRALVTMVSGSVVCIILNFLFVKVLGWGVMGSALATVLGQAVSAVLVLWYFTITKGTPIKIRLHCMKLVPSVVKDVITLGVASFLLQIAVCVSNLVVNHQLVKYGAMCPIGSENALAAIGLVNRCATIAVMPITGVSAAAQPLLGFNYGAGKLKRVRKTLGFAILYAFILGVCMWLITRIWPMQIVSAFGVSDKLMDLAIYALQVQMLLIPLIGLQICTSNYFQATGQPAKSILLSLTRQVLFMIPSLLILPVAVPFFNPSIEGLYAIFASWPLSDALSIITASSFIAWELRRLKKIEAGLITDNFVGVSQEEE